MNIGTSSRNNTVTDITNALDGGKAKAILAVAELDKYDPYCDGYALF